jgi:hypothetical protein
MESDNSANTGSNASIGISDPPEMVVSFPDSLREEREDGRSGVVGRDVGLRDLDAERLVPLLSRGFVEYDMI